MGCEVCTVIKYPSDEEVSLRLSEGEYWRATLRVSDQRLPGTSFLTLKEHKSSISDLDRLELVEFQDMFRKLEQSIMISFGALVINTSCLMNLAFRNDDPSPHIHWHLKPRYKDPVNIEGEVFEDLEFGSYLSGNQRKVRLDNDMNQQIAMRIRENLEANS